MLLKATVFHQLSIETSIAGMADFLKKEYGIGGHLPAVSGATHSQMDHDSKGIRLRKERCEDVLLKWDKVAQRIEELIRKDRYLSPEALQKRLSFS